MTNYKVAHLRIETFRGTSLGATHFYGHLCYYDSKGEYHQDELKHRINSKEATYLTQRDRAYGFSSLKWTRGDTSECFSNKEQVIAGAIDRFKTSFVPHGYKLLLLGFSGDPTGVLFSVDSDLQEKLMDLNRQAEAIGRWEGDEKLMAKICQKWDKLINSV
jgi:hypothetical protein